MIREINPTDTLQLLHLNRAMWLEATTGQNLAFSANKLRKMYKKIISCDTKLALVDEKDGELTGFLFANIEQPCWTNESCADEYAFFVDKEHRGTGTAVKLITKYIEWAKEKQVQAIYISGRSGLKADKLHKFYSRLGFSPAGGTYFMGV